MRVSEKAIKGTSRLLSQIEADRLCRYLVVLAIDPDDNGDALIASIDNRPRVERCIVIENPPKREGEPFKLCNVWSRMANKAWEAGTDWVVLLRDDIEIDTTYHYKETYCTFLDIETILDCPPWFGRPYWNDLKFPGFPSFPVVGCQHYEIFGALIPPNRANEFVNQDLDPYLQSLYLKFQAGLPMKATLINMCGGDETDEARYHRVPAEGWRDWVLEDVQPIKHFLITQQVMLGPEIFTLDVVVPTYRLNFEYLRGICLLSVPSGFRTSFIIVVDNPELLVQTGSKSVSDMLTPDEAAPHLERRLFEAAEQTNNIRVRCNAKNGGASYSRNHGIDESSAEFVLFHDDDVVPVDDLLHAYYKAICNLEEDEAGLVGLVPFPHSERRPMKYASILMSYLTFMFEIANNKIYLNPAWGVTANILLRRTLVRFDIHYAKTGGGEDVDYCLRVSQETGMLKACPSAVVHHNFWPGSPIYLS
jgi:glycosyltransferase involved in cell wall biosynthesis